MLSTNTILQTNLKLCQRSTVATGQVPSSPQTGNITRSFFYRQQLVMIITLFSEVWKRMKEYDADFKKSHFAVVN